MSNENGTGDMANNGVHRMFFYLEMATEWGYSGACAWIQANIRECHASIWALGLAKIPQLSTQKTQSTLAPE